jgi:C1A family cysteine protease
MIAKVKPNRVLLVVVSIVASLTLLVRFGSLPGLAAIPAGPEIPQVAPLNPDFLKFIANRPAKFYGYVPPPVDLRHLKNIPVGQLAPEGHSTLEAPLSLPDSFDWRTTGKVTPVKDQNPCGTCWIFGALAALESKVLIGENTAFNFSEQNVACCTDPSWVYLTSPPDYRCMGGGWSWLAADTLSKKGTRQGACDPYNTATINTETCNDTCITTKYVTGYRLLGVNTADIQEAVYDHGPVSVAIYMDTNPIYYNSTTNVYTYTGSATPNHIVCIVGWNDTIAYPGGSGAWIIKNSWGTDWGGTCGYGLERGYFYLAYGSGNIQEAARYEYKDYSASEKIYYWDEAGWVASAGYGSDYAWMANVFTMTASGTLTHVDFWATSNDAGYEIKAYQDSNPVDGLTNQLTFQSGNCQEAGYYSIALNSPISVSAGEKYTIAVKMTTTGYNYSIPIEIKWPSTGKTMCDPPIQTGVSYMSPDGTSWTDIGADKQLKWNACLRATVSEGLVSVTVTPSTIAYGTVALGTSKNTTPGQHLTVTNNGGTTANFFIKSSNATRDGGTNWTLVTATPGNNEFKHEFSTNSGSTWTALITGYQSLATGIAPNATQVFDLQITMPSSTTDYLEHTIVITILAVAAAG